MAEAEKSFSIIVLGGLGEIGMNCLAIDAAGRLLIIDCGAMFSSEGLGIELIHPAFDALAERRSDIEGVVLTHAHEDHIAGIPFLLRELDVPVYGTSYALRLLRERMDEIGPAPKLVSRAITLRGDAQIGPFGVRTFPMPHSIVENLGLVIETPAHRILHTGDFKLLLKEPDRGAAALACLSEAAEGGIDLMLSDSTGSEESEIAGSESAVHASIDELVNEAHGRVFIAIFSSNVQRLKSILNVAAKCGRQVTFCGRSVQSHVRAALDIGAIEVPRGLVVSLEEAASLPAEKILVVASGTQGEARSALGRLAVHAHHALHVEQGDLIILSSRFIPGNELAIGRMIDRFHQQGARVAHRGLKPEIHVSGHGSKTEILAAIKAVSPRSFLPIHGTYRHLVAGAELARNAGVPHVAVAADGQIVNCSADGLSVREGRFPARNVYIDGGGGLTENAIKDRRILASHGVLVVTFATDANGSLRGSIEVIARGVVLDEVLPWLAGQVRLKIASLLSDIDLPDRRDKERCREIVRLALRKYLLKLIGREPYVLVSILPAQ